MKTPITKKPKPTIKPTLSGIVERSPVELKPWPNNPRTHSDKQLVILQSSIGAYGFTNPVLVDETGVILSGHGRVQAALAMGLASVPTRVISGLSAASKRAYVLGDNKIAQLSAWNPDLLKSEMELLIEDDFDFEATGFSTAEVDLMFEDSTGDPADLLPEDVVDEVITRRDDMWVLGAHRLYCGDALQLSSFACVMAGALAEMAITDPPYNVPINGHVCGNGKVKHKEFAMAAGEMSSGQFSAFLQTTLSHVRDVSADGAISFVCMDWRHAPELLEAAKPLFGAPRQMCVWVKDNAGMGTFYRSQHELVYVFKKGDAPHINNFELGQHGRYRTNVWQYPGVNTFKGKGYELLKLHPTVKPVGLIADAIRDCSHRKGIVLDPFAGSGTVLLAAERTGRYARAIEFDAHYVDVAIHRWQRLTGGQAVLEATGQTWEQVRAERLAGTPAQTMVEVSHGL
jgi:DNA modification methylase